jgi:peptidoglycan/xylan/chitin deacetylase (PgdA/CDA1 family)
MNTVAKYIIGFGSRICSKQKPAEIYYHDINMKNKKLSYNSIPKEIYEDQIRLLKNKGIQTILFSELDKNQDSYKILISYDDGYKSLYDIAYPIALKYEIKMNIFIIPKMIIEKNEKYLTKWQIKEMAKSGLVEFGSHTYSHIKVKKIDEEFVNKELILANEIIEDITGKRPMDFCFPFGYNPDYIIEEISKIGIYSRIYTSDLRLNYKLNGFDVIGRIGIEADDPKFIFLQKATGRFGLYRALKKSKYYR